MDSVDSVVADPHQIIDTLFVDPTAHTESHARNTLLPIRSQSKIQLSLHIIREGKFQTPIHNVVLSSGKSFSAIPVALYTRLTSIGSLETARRDAALDLTLSMRNKALVTGSGEP